MVAVVLPAMIGLVGMLTDTGILMASRRHAQRAADAAAQAAAVELANGGSNDPMGRVYAAANATPA